mmetsp:Transcript_7423/g.11301  ORF Transcript_7423/g.11301 Transcript_7423/m.11301 type:complete len:159 (-) Transcript_7423:117-593(-)
MSWWWRWCLVFVWKLRCPIITMSLATVLVLVVVLVVVLVEGDDSNIDGRGATSAWLLLGCRAVDEILAVVVAVTLTVAVVGVAVTLTLAAAALGSILIPPLRTLYNGDDAAVEETSMRDIFPSPLLVLVEGKTIQNDLLLWKEKDTCTSTSGRNRIQQ